MFIIHFTTILFFLKEIIANILLGPSYVSLDLLYGFMDLYSKVFIKLLLSVLNDQNLLIHLMGCLAICKLKKNYLILALTYTKSCNFIIASKEKALCDKVYFTKDIDLRSQKAMKEFLEDDLRVDMDELENCDIKIFEEYVKVSKSKNRSSC